MKALMLLFFLLVSVGFSAPATLPTLTVSGETYTAVKVTKADAITATIHHSGGISRVPIDKLPPAVQTAIGYDPAEAQAAMDAAAAKRAEAEKMLKYLSRRFRIEFNMEEGLVVEQMEVSEDTYTGSTSLGRLGGGGGPSPDRPKRYSWEGTGKKFFIGHTAATGKMPIGTEFTARVEEAGTARIDNSEVMPRFRIVKLEPNQPATKPL